MRSNQIYSYTLGICVVGSNPTCPTKLDTDVLFTHGSIEAYFYNPGSNPGLRKENDWLAKVSKLPNIIKVNCFLLQGIRPHHY
ncbi:hypothetical protein [Flammeovirga sp. SubArs3]|uniref:hypothetical protein n=1 Tax=Flammeovirga sp. SubArs3 TaxID=2995316 RepID=UPI00248B1B4D|nr:hypothetical protein [Flammeovirga sp. SubArs3]